MEQFDYNQRLLKEIAELKDSESTITLMPKPDRDAPKKLEASIFDEYTCKNP